ncbi:MAG: amino acid ABC transporter permease [Rhizobium sp.]
MRDFVFADAVYIASMAWVTLQLALVAFVFGLLGGTLLAVARSSRFLVPRVAAMIYVRVFQGTPLLIQILTAFFAPSFLLGIDVGGWTAAVVALSLNATAYAGEIIRGCLEAIPKGQTEASSALGLGYFDRMRDVVVPQALRIAIPPLIGLAVQIVKGTSLASVVSLVELTKAASRINSVTFEPVPTFAVVSAIYFLICWPLSLAGRTLEARLAK